MKTLIVILLAAGVSFASTYFIVSNQRAAAFRAAQQNWENEKAQLLAASKTAAPAAAAQTIVMQSAPSAPAEESPQDILNDLLGIKIGSGEARNTALRLVVFKLETLAQRGDAAIPAIQTFIVRNVDVDYGQQDSQNQNNNPATADANGGNTVNNTNNNGGNNQGFNRGNNGRFGGGRGGRLRRMQDLQTDWIAPPSLRLGLVGVLKEIGGAQAEQALGEMLASTARGVEVAYLARVLEEIAPGKYRDAAIKAAKDLLMNPPTIDSPDQLDALSKSYLYSVLEFYKDTSFAINAQQMLVGTDGRLDQDAMDYLSTVLKDQSVSALYSAYQNSNLTNQFDKMNLGREILNYAGQNPQANQLFTDTLNNADLDSRMKAMAVLQLAGGGFGPFSSDTPTDPQTISGRIALLNSVAAQAASDPTLVQAINAATTALQNGQPIQRQDMRAIFRGGGGGGGGN